MRDRILHYRLERRLGAGGMGEVWLARDLRLEREVALKFLSPSVAASPTARERLLREARAVSGLDHPNILRVFAVETTEEEGDFLVLEYVDGRTLRRVIEEGPLDLRDALDLAAQLADGLHAAHEHGVVHRDVKPENALVDRRGRVRVMDFGLSKVRDAVRLTVEGSTLGTLAYMSPEQARAEELDARTDAFSFGMVLFELVSGRLPFRHASITPATAVQAILHDPPEPLSRFRAGVPEALQRLVEALLRKDREKRPGDMSAVAAELRAIRTRIDPGAAVRGDPDAGLAHRATRIEGTPTVTTGAAVGPRGGRGTSVRAWIAAGVVGGAVFAAFLLHGGGNDPAAPATVDGAAPPAAATASPPPAPAPSAGAPADATPARPAGAPRPGFRVVRQRPLATGGRDAGDPTLSPDGSQVAFVMADEAGVRQIWIRSLDEGDPLPLTRQPRDCSFPRWAPRGGLVSFCMDEGHLGTPLLRLQSVWVVAPPTGTPRKVIANAYSPSWSHDGARILFDDFSGVASVAVDGGERTPVEGLPAPTIPLPVRRPRWSPDGSRIAIFQNDLGPAGDYWVAAADGTGLRRLTSRTDEGGGFDWTADGSALVVSAAWGGAKTLWRVPVDGGAPEPVTSGTGEDTDPDVSPDGRRIVFVNARHTFALKVLDTATGDVRTLLESRTAVAGPVFSPDGTTIAFCGGDEPGMHIVLVGSDGRGLRAVSRGERELHLYPEWSADGASLRHYRKSADGRFTWESMPAAGGPGKVLREGWSIHNQVYARVSPDGGRVLYLLNRGLRTLPETVIESMTGGQTTRLTTVVFYGRWSPDGRRIAGADMLGRIVAVEVDGGATRVVGPGVVAAWSPDGAWLYWLGPDGEAPAGSRDVYAIHRAPADGSGDPQRVVSLGPVNPYAAMFDVSSRGEVAWVDFREGRKEIWVLEVE